ncbi:MAG: recombinase family protein [Clostridia bacterium]|nr:recombinase family protein [Clostridia bacterium]
MVKKRTGPVTAGVYIRQSVEKRDSCSLEMQERACRELCETRGWDVKIYRDSGLSGKDTDRPALQRLIRDVKNGAIQMVVVYKLDRISRSLLDLLNLLHLFSEHGVGIRSITETMDTTSPAGRAMVGIIGSFAQFEREMIRDRVRDNMLDRAKNGIWNGGVLPYGYDRRKTVVCVNGREKTVTELVRSEEEAENVLRFFEWFLEPQGAIRKTANLANAHGIRTKGGSPWGTTSMGRLLRNPTVCIADRDALEYFTKIGAQIVSPPSDFDGVHGILPYNRREGVRKTSRPRDVSDWIISVGTHLGIVPGKVFVAAQKKLEARKPPRAGTGSKGLLAWLVKCGYCGKAMSFGWSRKKGREKEYRYYSCYGRRDRLACTNRPVRADELEEKVLDLIRKVCSDREFLNTCLEVARQEIASQAGPLQEEERRLKKKAAGLENQERRLVDALARGNLPVDLVEEKIAALRQEIRAARARLEEIRDELEAVGIRDLDAEAVYARLRSFNEVFDNLDFEEKRALIRDLVEKVVVTDDRVVVHLYYMPQSLANGAPASVLAEAG